jgi:tetratricopeptide (TPR) repeat protein
LSDLAQTLWLAGKNDLSKRAGERAVKGLMKHLGPDDPVTLSAMFNLARTYHHLRDYKKSHEYLVSVVKKRKRFFGSNHPDTLMARTELGTSYRALGQMELAERLVENVLKARKKTLGEEHAYTLWSVNELSQILCDRGRSEKAVSVLEEIVPIAIRTLGEDHVGMSLTRSNLARAYALSKRWDDAEGLLQKLSGAIDSDRPDWIDVMSGYIHVRIKVGRLEETEKDCNKVLNIIIEKRVISLDDPRTLGIAETLLRIYQIQGRLYDILALKKRVTRLSKQNDGQESLLSVLYGVYSGDRNSLSSAAF